MGSALAGLKVEFEIWEPDSYMLPSLYIFTSALDIEAYVIREGHPYENT
jgi:hypothetical protein